MRAADAAAAARAGGGAPEMMFHRREVMGRLLRSGANGKS